jgi:hypothetical protein
MKRFQSTIGEVPIQPELPKELWLKVFEEVIQDRDSIWWMIVILERVHPLWRAWVYTVVRVVKLKHPQSRADMLLGSAIVKRMINLERLDTMMLREPKLSQLMGFIHLRDLNIQFSLSPIDEEGVGLGSFTNLTTLVLGHHSVKLGGLRKLTNLTSLTLCCGGGNKDSDVEMLTRLKHLSTENSLTNRSISRFTQLTSLDLTENEYITDDAISLLKNLQTLCLFDNELITDQGILGLNSLTNLELCQTKKITDYGLGYLTNLETLDLNNNDVVRGGTLLLLTKLTSLNLKYNSIIEDETLRGLTQLTELDLTSNKVISDFGLFPLTSLRKLSISDSDITDEGLGGMKNLKFLDISANEHVTALFIHLLQQEEGVVIEQDSFEG